MSVKQGKPVQGGAQSSTSSGAAPERAQEEPYEMTAQEIRVATREQLMLNEILWTVYRMGQAQCILQYTGLVYKY